MNSKAKKLVFATVIFLLVVAAWQSVFGDGMHVNIDGDEIDGPLGAILAVLFAGGGLALAAVIMTSVAVFLGVLFAGLGLVMVSGMVLAAAFVALAISPLLLPLLIPVGIYMLLTRRSRKQRMRATMEQAV
jgi:hypothetical protein